MLDGAQRRSIRPFTCRSVLEMASSRDEDGNALMSLEELKEGMFQSIRDSGTVELIRVRGSGCSLL